MATVRALVRRIHLIRGCRVMLDADVARLYGVPTKRLNQQVRRNPRRFPEDFAFTLSPAEETALRLQNATSNKRRGGRRHASLALTEHGALMAAAVLNSPRAVEMSIFVVRAFVQLRHLLETHEALASRLFELERKVSGHRKAIAGIFDALRDMKSAPVSPRRGIGFAADIR
jgi:hypothetical protein